MGTLSLWNKKEFYKLVDNGELEEAMKYLADHVTDLLEMACETYDTVDQLQRDFKHHMHMKNGKIVKEM